MTRKIGETFVYIFKHLSSMKQTLGHIIFVTMTFLVFYLLILIFA